MEEDEFPVGLCLLITGNSFVWFIVGFLLGWWLL